jgi:multiple sugar transport system permease protein
MKPPRRKKYSSGEVLTSYAFLLPTFVGIALFSLLPLILSFIDSFYNYGFYQDRAYVGMNNYRLAMIDKYFRNAIFVGLKFVLIVVPLQIVASFFFANLVKGLGRRTASFVKTSIIVPTVVSGVIASLIFVFIFDYQGGILNNILKRFGVPLQAWFQDRNLAMLSIAAPRIWLGFGYSSLFMLGALLDIPESYYEAAKIDGAGAWLRMLRITLPSMKNIILFLLVSGIVASMQEFDMPFNMTGGGPARATETPALFVYNHFVRDPTIGFSLSSALVIALVLGSMSSIVFKLVNSEKSWE